MSDLRLERLQELVAEALERDPADRAAFLQESCGDDAELRAEAESLLGQDTTGGAFLEASARAWLAGDSEWAETGAGQLRAGDVLGECRIVSLLGEGGMGEVYLAEDTRLERRVALKVLKRKLGDETLGRRLQHERKVLAALNHPNIARLYGGATTPEGRSYLVMEYVEGERLDRYCNARQLAVDGRLAIFRKVCAAVSYAHQNLVVHRDLKPANIRVTPEGEPKLLDFGIAKLLDPEVAPVADPTVTMFGAMTPEYASPEQVRGEATTTASDVYSLGVVLFELLTGQRPYRLKTRRPDELVRAICEEEAPRPSTVAGTGTAAGDRVSPALGEAPARLRWLLEGDLDNIVAKALRKEPSRRYGSVAELAEDLRRHAEGLPVSARPDTIHYRAGKFVSRHKTLVAAAALVTLALLGGIVAATSQARVARQERDRAQTAQAEAETALRQAERINSFLQNLFSSPDATKQGKDVKVLQVLDAAGGHLDRDLGNEPEVLAQVHLTMARTYTSLLVSVGAIKHAQAAYDLLRRLNGEDHPATVEALVILGLALTDTTSFERAEPLLRQALASLNRQSEPNPRLKARVLLNLALVLTHTKRMRDAEATLAEAKSFILATGGENGREYVQVLNLSGIHRRLADDNAAAAALHREALALFDRIQGGGIESLTIQQNLCVALFALHQFDALEEAVGRLERDAKQIAGERSRVYIVTLCLSALCDFSRARYPQAAATSRRALDGMLETFPPASLNVVQIAGVLGVSLTRSGRAPEGEPLLRQTLVDGQKASKFEFNNTFGNFESALGECLLAQGRHADAEPLLLGGHDELKARLGEAHVQSIRVKRLLHDLYTAWNKPEQAARFAGRRLGQSCRARAICLARGPIPSRI